MSRFLPACAEKYLLIVASAADPTPLTSISHSHNFPEPGYLAGWKDTPNSNTHLTAFQYDVTPKEYLDVLVCEHGAVGLDAIGSVQRVVGLDR